MPFTPVHTLFGGALLSLSTTSLLSDTGRVFGASGIVREAIWGDHASWRLAILSGLFAGPFLLAHLGWEGRVAADALGGWSTISVSRATTAGFIVGLGASLGSGCTSGHMLCGVSRGSKRSIVATATFFTTALITANLTNNGPEAALPVGTTPFTTAKNLPDPPLILLTSCLLGLFAIRFLLSSPRPPPAPTRIGYYFLCGLTFSLGLIISGMTDPTKVLSFLKPFSPSFDPSLAMIVIAGVLPNAFHWMTITKGKVRFHWEKWQVPSRTEIDWRLISGAALFGIGWGLAGVCPAPALIGFGRLVLGSLRGEKVEEIGKAITGFCGLMFFGLELGSLF